MRPGRSPTASVPAVASTEGYALAFSVGAVLLAVGGVLVMVLLERVSATPRNVQAEITATPAAVPAP